MAIDINRLHPNWRYLHLTHIRQLRMMARTGHPMYRSEARSMIKKAQREMADIRAALEVDREAYQRDMADYDAKLEAEETAHYCMLDSIDDERANAYDDPWQTGAVRS